MHAENVNKPLQHRGLKIAIAIGVLITAVFLLGPVNEFGPDIPTNRANPPAELNALDSWLAHSESSFDQLRAGTAKGIVWASELKTQTPWSVVYIHGFSATRLETAPLAEQVASSLGANLYYTRLSGHGLDGDALAKASAQDWMADTIEAIQIGKLLGKKVLVISCSTGSTLSTWYATRSDASNVDAHVFISPNFGLRNKLSELINGHWGQQIAFAVSGDSIRYEQTDPREALAWTNSYPTQSLFPMLALVKKARESDLTLFKQPLLVLYSAADQTVDPENTKEVFSRIGSTQKTIEAITYSNSKGQHVLTGAIRDPDSVSTMSNEIVQWLKDLNL